MSIAVSDKRTPQWLRNKSPYKFYPTYEVIVNQISLGTYANNEVANEKAQIHKDKNVLIIISDGAYIDN